MLPFSMPGIERICRVTDRLEGFGRVEQPVVGSEAGVLAQKLKTEVAGKDPSSVAETCGVGRVAGVMLGVKHADRQL